MSIKVKMGLKSGRGRDNKLGQDWPQRRAVSQWPHLWSMTHTCHPLCCLSLFFFTHTHTYITYCICTHSCMLACTSTRRGSTYTCTQRQMCSSPKRHTNLHAHKHTNADTSLCTPAGGPCCTLLNSHDTCSQPLGISCSVPFLQLILHPLSPSPFLLCFLPVSETDVFSELDRHQRPHHFPKLM